MHRISTGTASELKKFLLLMQTIGLPPTPEKFEIFKNRGRA